MQHTAAYIVLNITVIICYTISIHIQARWLCTVCVFVVFSGLSAETLSNTAEMHHLVTSVLLPPLHESCPDIWCEILSMLSLKQH